MTSPSRGQNILDLSFTTNPNLVDKLFVLAKVIAKLTIVKQLPRYIPLYKKADCDQLKQSTRDLQHDLKSGLATADTHIMWDRFVARLQQGIDDLIPVGKAGTRDGFPWINNKIHRHMRKRDQFYNDVVGQGDLIIITNS